MKMENKLKFGIISILFFLFLIVGINGAEVYNTAGDFSITVNSLKSKVYNDNIDSILKFKITNNLENSQKITLDIPEKQGWDIILKEESFNLRSGESKEVSVNFKVNSAFTYNTEIVTPNSIKITQKDKFKGSSTFPINILGLNENISLNYNIEIDKREIEDVSYSIAISTEDISPNSPLKYTVTANNLKNDETVFVSFYLNNKLISEEKRTFTSENFYQFFFHKISNILDPGIYELKIVVRSLDKDLNSAKEWFEIKNIKILNFENLIISKREVKSYINNVEVISIYNDGNKKTTYRTEVKNNFFNRLFLTSNYDYKNTKDGILFEIELEKGERVNLEYSYNYLLLYLIFFALLIFSIFIFVKKNSNPILIETKFYDIEKVYHEGVKSFKVRLGFENVKEGEIDNLKLIFRMPAYINIKDNSFLLSEPNQVLKSKNQYKLIWNFKRFEKSDSRILGFTLENKRGVLGDIKFEDLEIEVKNRGKTRKYYKSLPIIKG